MNNLSLSWNLLFEAPVTLSEPGKLYKLRISAVGFVLDVPDSVLQDA